MPNSFDPRKYQDSGARFQAWQAAGSPGEDMYGNTLDTRGEVANLMFDPNYVAANKNSFSNYNGKSDWLQTYFSPQNQGLQSFMRQGGVVDPWAKTFMDNNPSGGGQVPGGVSMPAPNPIPHGGPTTVGPGGVSMPAPNPIPHGGPTVAGPTRPAGAELPNPVNRQPPPSPITTGTLPRTGSSTQPTTLNQGYRGPSSQNPILIASGATGGGIQGQPSYTPPINIAGGNPKAGTPIAGSVVGKEQTSGQAWHGGPAYVNNTTSGGSTPQSGQAVAVSTPEVTNYVGGPTYREYLEQGRLYYGVQTTEGGEMEFTPQYTETEWNALPALARYAAFLPNSVNPNFYRISEDNPLYQQFYQQFGQSDAVNNSGFELNNERMSGLAIGYNNDSNGVAGPQYGRLDWNQLAIDPSRLMWIDPEGTPNRRFIYERGNARGDAVAGEQHRESNSGLGDNAGLIMAGLVLGGGLLGNALLPGAAGAGVGGEAVAGAGAGAGVGGEAVAGAGAGAGVGGGAVTGAVAGSIPSWIASQLPSGITASQFFSALRTAGSVAGAVRMLTGQGGGGSSGGSGGSGSSGGSGGSGSSGGSGGNNSSGLGIALADLIQGGLSNYQANRNIGSFNTMINEMLTRGDPYSGERANAIARLRALESNPGSVTSNPLFQSMNDKSQADLQRIFAARGLNISGNEMGGLQENFLANMNKFYGDEWNRIAREAGVFFDPTNIAAAGMRAAGDMFGARNNRDAGMQALLSMLLGGGGQGEGLNLSNITSWFGNLFNGGNNNENSGMTDEEFEQWWNDYINGGGSSTNNEPMPYDEGGYGGW